MAKLSSLSTLHFVYYQCSEFPDFRGSVLHFRWRLGIILDTGDNNCKINNCKIHTPSYYGLLWATYSPVCACQIANEPESLRTRILPVRLSAQQLPYSGKCPQKSDQHQQLLYFSLIASSRYASPQVVDTLMHVTIQLQRW